MNRNVLSFLVKAMPDQTLLDGATEEILVKKRADAKLLAAQSFSFLLEVVRSPASLVWRNKPRRPLGNGLCLSRHPKGASTSLRSSTQPS